MKKTSVFVKGLIMAIVGFVANYIGNTDSSLIDWAYMGIATGIFTVIYLITNFTFPSISVAGVLDLRDMLKGVLLAGAMAISDIIASVSTAKDIDWKLTLMAAIIAMLGYLSKTIVGTGKAK